jgi:tetratricopeptide (TPR) repeat protein
LEFVELAAEKGALSSLPARNSLAWMAFMSDDMDSAEEYCCMLLDDFPGRRSFLWCKAKIHKERKEWDKAIIAYKQLLVSVRSESRNNHFNEIGILHSLVLSNFKLEQWNEVVTLADEAFNIDASPAVAERKEKDFHNLTKMRHKARKMIESH